jgi:hypothetical protein
MCFHPKNNYILVQLFNIQSQLFIKIYYLLLHQMKMFRSNEQIIIYHLFYNFQEILNIHYNLLFFHFLIYLYYKLIKNIYINLFHLNFQKNNNDQ